MLLRHLKDRNIGYFPHWCCAVGYSIKLYVASQVLLIHAFLPFLFETTATDIIKGIINETDQCQE